MSARTKAVGARREAMLRAPGWGAIATAKRGEGAPAPPPPGVTIHDAVQLARPGRVVVTVGGLDEERKAALVLQAERMEKFSLPPGTPFSLDGGETWHEIGENEKDSGPGLNSQGDPAK